MAEKFQKKSLNKKDHEKEDKRANNVKMGLGIGGTVVMCAVAVVKFVPKAIKTITKI